MGVDYDANLVVGWPIEIPEGTNDVDDYLSPLCRVIGKKACFVTEGNSFSGDHSYYISITDSEETEHIIAAIAAHEKLAGKLKLAGAKIGPFCIKAVGHVW